MTEFAPASVLLMGLFGLLVVAFALARIALLEHKVQQVRVVRLPGVASDTGTRIAA